MKIIFFYLIFIQIIFSNEATKTYGQAYKIEKISPILSINLYEKAISSKNINKKILKMSLSRLFYLYHKYSMYEEIFLLNENFPNDKSRQKKTDKIIRKIATNLKVDEIVFKKIIGLAVKKDEYSLKTLILEYNKTPNLYLLSYVFAIKLKQFDNESVSYLISEIPNINPVLKFYYYVKVSSKLTMTTTVEKVLQEVSSISDLTNSQKADILFFYAGYLEEKKRYRHSLRFYKMSSTYSKKEERTNLTSNNQIAKIFLTIGESKKACNLYNDKPRVSSESDEILHLYCNKKQILKSLKLPISNLYARDNSVFYKIILAEIGKI